MQVQDEQATKLSFPLVAKAIRIRIGAGRTEWANKLGVTRQAITRFEDPANGTGEEVLRRYADAAGRPWPDALVDELIALRDGRSPAQSELEPAAAQTAPPRKRRSAVR